GRRQQARRAFRRHHARRMWIERQHGSLPSARLGHRPDAAEDSAVPVVDSVEVADRQRARPEIGRRVVQAAEDLHATWTSNPSYASRTWPGRRLSARSWPRSWQMCVRNVRRGFNSSAVFTALSTVVWVGWGL